MKTIIAGNWKMNLLLPEAQEYMNKVNEISINDDKEVILFTPSIYLQDGVKTINNEKVSVGAQNIHQEPKGAFTGEISAPMVQSLGVKHTLVGHSERREYFNESDVLVNKKVLEALNNDIQPMICVGETLAERQGNLTNSILDTQVQEALKDVDTSKMASIQIAYEPLWAIGTGEVATKEQAQEACAHIRQTLTTMYGEEVANNTAILYGGSVNLENFNDILAQQDINGVLVGGASLNIDGFKEMMQ